MMDKDRRECPGITIALAGNVNVGKSALFNQLTGLEQVVGNYPDKTMEYAEGRLDHDGVDIRLVDLPGIFSLSADRAQGETREHVLATAAFIRSGKADAIVNVVDATALERNLFLTIQLIASGIPVVVALNLTDQAAKKGIHTDLDVLSEELGVPVMGIIAVRGTGVHELVDVAIEAARGEKPPKARFDLGASSEEVFSIAGRIASESQTVSKHARSSGTERIDRIAMHPFWGYVILLGTMIGIITFISLFGGMIARLIEDGFESFNPNWTGFWGELLWSGGMVGLYSSLGIALGFLLPFYLILSALENSGYLPRISFLMDRPCHTMGLHGRAVIPIVTAFGCNVPACVGCRIIGDKRDRIIATVLSTLVPCSARTAVILGIVGIYMGPLWAVLIYLLDFAIIIAVGRAMHRFIRGGSSGLVLEIPSYRVPEPSLLWRQAWARFRPFLTGAVPFIVGGSLVIEALRLLDTLDDISSLMEPITVWWLGLPSFTIVLLFLGVLRKEATVVLLSTVAGTTAIDTVMTEVQMFVFVLVITLYIPCIATIGVLIKELGWKVATAITVGEIILALVVGGIAYRILSLFM